MIRLKKNNRNNCSALWSWAIVFFLASSLMSCSGNIYDETREIQEASWNEADSIAFSFEIADTSQRYNIFLTVNHEVAYAFQNIYCLVETYGPQGLSQRQVSSLELASRKGNWLGDCGEENCVRRIPFIVNTLFDQAGAYQIVLKQYSRPKQLPHVQSLRLEVVPVEG